MRDDAQPAIFSQSSQASPPPPPSPSIFWSWLRPAMHDADSIPSDRPSRGSDWVIGAGFDPAARQAETLATDADLGDSKRNNPVLFLDSVTSCHAAADRWCLSDFHAVSLGDGPAVHRTRDGRELPIAGSGSVARGNFKVPGVRYVPGLPAGTILISVQQLAAWGYLVMFGGGKCLVMDRSGGKPVGQGFLQEDDGFYRLQFLKISLDLEHN